MPRWVHGADLVVVSTPLAMVTLGVFGPTRLHLGPLDLSISSFPRLIVILLVTLTSRHFLVPKPTIVARAIDAFSRLPVLDDNARGDAGCRVDSPRGLRPGVRSRSPRLPGRRAANPGLA